MNLFSYAQLASIVHNLRKGGGARVEEVLESISRKMGEEHGLRGKAREGELDRFFLDNIVEFTRKKGDELLELSKGRVEMLRKSLEGTGCRRVLIKAKLEERGLFGASQRFGKTLFEVGLEFDPYLNLPVIPGSSLKGAAKCAYEVLRGARTDWPTVEEVFGSKGQEGRTIFFDGYPVEKGRGRAILYPDVMTPHYKKGSGEDMFEEFGWDPRPITYLTVAPDTVFQFIVAFRDVREDILLEVLREAFELGIGAKTSVGYGRLSVVEANVE